MRENSRDFNLVPTFRTIIDLYLYSAQNFIDIQAVPEFEHVPKVK